MQWRALCFVHLTQGWVIKSRKMRWVGTYNAKKRYAYRFLVVKPEEKKPLGSYRHGW